VRRGAALPRAAGPSRQPVIGQDLPHPSTVLFGRVMTQRDKNVNFKIKKLMLNLKIIFKKVLEIKKKFSHRSFLVGALPGSAS
jgi:hypothetical protein